MDLDSDLEADQVAQDVELDLRQAPEQVRLVAEAQERCQEYQKRQEEEKKAQTFVAMKLAAEQAAELVVDREWRILLKVSLEILWLFNWKLTSDQKDLETLVMTPEPLLAPSTDKGKEASCFSFLSIVLELKTRTERAPWDQWRSVL